MSKISTEQPSIVTLSSSAEELSDFLSKHEYSSIFVVFDENTEKYCAPFLSQVFTAKNIRYQGIVIAAGEEYKTLESAQTIWKSLADYGADRSSILINCGGGMICDLGGFAASLYKRGIDFIHLPTTLLAMVDASIGGKCGVDFDQLKNQIGVFQNPQAIFVCPPFLNTLPALEMKSGMAEVYKHSLIADTDLWSDLQDLELDDFHSDLVLKAYKIKEAIVSKDPYENGERKLLNFGHTVGHGIESLFLAEGRPIPHGFAIATGMIVESFLSMKMNGLPEEDYLQIKHRIVSIYPKLEWSDEQQSQIIQFIKGDKKNKAGKLLFVLLSKIGRAEYDIEVHLELLTEALNVYRNEH